MKLLRQLVEDVPDEVRRLVVFFVVLGVVLLVTSYVGGFQ